MAPLFSGQISNKMAFIGLRKKSLFFDWRDPAEMSTDDKEMLLEIVSRGGKKIWLF